MLDVRDPLWNGSIHPADRPDRQTGFFVLRAWRNSSWLPFGFTKQSAIKLDQFAGHVSVNEVVNTEASVPFLSFYECGSVGYLHVGQPNEMRNPS